MELFSDRYRRIWVQETRLGSLCITLFPIDGSNYKIVTRQRMGEITFEKVRDIILSLD